MTTRQRAYKYRFYPTPEQELNLNRTFGCARYVYNRGLEMRTTAWKDGIKKPPTVASQLAVWKREPETEFLKEVSSVTLMMATQNLGIAFDNFFAKRASYPRFKSKRRSTASASYSYMAFSLKWIDGGGTAAITLAKQREPLNIVWSRPLPDDWYPNRMTVTRDSAGRYFISILMQEDILAMPVPQNSVIGVDLGLTDFVATDAGEKYQGPKTTRKYADKLARAQRELMHKQKGSKNRAKARFKVARVHAKIADTRKDFLHKLSTKLIRENQTIICETLAVKNMVQNRSLAKSISDASWSEFVSMLEYKAEWYGRDLVKIDQWFPSTQLCSTSGCSFRNRNLSLGNRFWTCPECLTVHDRDINAAKNIVAAGLAVMAHKTGPSKLVESASDAIEVRLRSATLVEAGSPRE